VEDLVENVLPYTVTEVAEGAIGRRLQEIESTKETESGIITKGRGELAIRADLAEVDEKLSLK
jgi:hypothetical protein